MRWAVLIRHRFLWMWMKNQNRAGQWPMVHADWKTFSWAGTRAVTGQRFPAPVSEAVLHLAKGWKLLFCVTSEYLFVLITGLSFSGIRFWHSAMMYLSSPTTFFRYSHSEFILQKHSAKIPSRLLAVFWFFFSVSQHDRTLSVSAALAWTALFRRVPSQLHSFTSAKSTGRAICSRRSLCRQTFGLCSSNRSPLPWIYLLLLSVSALISIHR